MKIMSASVSAFSSNRPVSSAEAARNQSLARGLTILQSFDITTPEAGIPELSGRVGLARSQRRVQANLVRTRGETSRSALAVQVAKVCYFVSNGENLADVLSVEAPARHFRQKTSRRSAFASDSLDVEEAAYRDD